MSIRDRLEDAQFLLSAKRHQGAFIQVLIAAAGTARKRYPSSEWDDSESFRNFIHDELGIITSAFRYGAVFPYEGRQVPIEDIFYQQLRCQLIHEGTMPESIEFSEPILEEGKLCDVMDLGSPFRIPVRWIEGLAKAIWLASENDDLWQDDIQRRQETRESMGSLARPVLYSRRPNQQSKQMKQQNERIEWTSDGKSYRLSYPPSTSSKQIGDALEEQLRIKRKREEKTGTGPIMAI